MSEPKRHELWNKINAPNTSVRDLEVGANEWGENPITVTIEATSRNDSDLTEWLSPNEARQIAAALIVLADAADAAGRNH